MPWRDQGKGGNFWPFRMGVVMMCSRQGGLLEEGKRLRMQDTCILSSKNRIYDFTKSPPCICTQSRILLSCKNGDLEPKRCVSRAELQLWLDLACFLLSRLFLFLFLLSLILLLLSLLTIVTISENSTGLPTKVWKF